MTRHFIRVAIQEQSEHIWKQRRGLRSTELVLWSDSAAEIVSEDQVNHVGSHDHKVQRIQAQGASHKC